MLNIILKDKILKKIDNAIDYNNFLNISRECKVLRNEREDILFLELVRIRSCTYHHTPYMCLPDLVGLGSYHTTKKFLDNKFVTINHSSYIADCFYYSEDVRFLKLYINHPKGNIYHLRKYPLLKIKNTPEHRKILQEDYRIKEYYKGKTIAEILLYKKYFL